MARNKTDVVILGGGVVGIACAYFLNRAGLSVQVLERGKVGQGASLANCGLITPSHALPLPGPGKLAKALKSIFNDSASLHIRPRIDPELLGWLLAFSRNCDSRRVTEIAAARAALLSSSRDLTEKLVRVENLDCQFEDSGLMAACVREEGMGELEQMVALHQELDIEANMLDADGLREAEPSLRSRVIGGAWFPRDAVLRPDRFTAELNWACHKKDVQVQEDCEIKAINNDGKALESVFTNRGMYEAKHFIVAAGAWTPVLLKSLKLKIPIQAGMGYTLTTRRPDPCPRFPLLLHDHGIAVSPFEDSYRIGGTMEFAGLDAAPNNKRFLALIDGARKYLTEPLGAGEPEKWHGYRPMTPDDLPLIGWVPRFGNLCMAAGHNMMGMSMAAATGRLVAELVTGRQTHIDAKPFSPARFRKLAA